MNEAHFHLMVNHFPIIAPIIGMLVLIVGIGLKNTSVERTAYAIFIFGAVSTFLAMMTGDKAEHFLENLPDVSHKLIHEHEELAERFMIFSYLLGLSSMLGFWSSVKKHMLYKFIFPAVFLLAIIVIYLTAAVGNSGGEIRHPEIRETTTVAE